MPIDNWLYYFALSYDMAFH